MHFMVLRVLAFVSVCQCLYVYSAVYKVVVLFCHLPLFYNIFFTMFVALSLWLDIDCYMIVSSVGCVC